MSLAVQVVFPGSTTLDKFQTMVTKLVKMGLDVRYLTGRSAPIHRTPAASIEDDTVTESLTSNEESLLDQGLKLTHKTGKSPLLDAMTAAGVGKLRPNMSREIVTYYQENPGHTTAQAAGNLANKFEAHYQDINDAFTRIRNLINTMCHAKGGQKALEKRGGFVGRGGSAQVFAVL